MCEIQLLQFDIAASTLTLDYIKLVLMELVKSLACGLVRVAHEDLTSFYCDLSEAICNHHLYGRSNSCPGAVLER